MFFTCDQGRPSPGAAFFRQARRLGTDARFEARRVHAAISADEWQALSSTTYSSRTRLRSYRLCSPGGSCQKFWQARSVADYGLVAPKFLEFKADDGTMLYGELLLPANATGKMPLLINVYGGPAGQTRDERVGRHHRTLSPVAGRKGYAIFSVDNRGTPNRDLKFQAAPATSSAASNSKISSPRSINSYPSTRNSIQSASQSGDGPTADP